MKHTTKCGLLWLVACLGGCDRPVSNAAPSATTPPAPAPATPASSSALAPSSPAVVASGAPARQPGGSPTIVTFNEDPVGAPAPAFDGVVGDWYVSEEAGGRGLKVDGGKWRSGTPSVSLADQAKRLYGDRYAEFLDGVKAFAFFPFAVWRGEPPTGNMRISVKFYPIAGQVDQAAGIAFAIAPDGTYLGVRANALEDNLLFFRVVKGRRTITDNIRDVPAPSKTWHTLAVELRGKQLTADVDGKRRLEKALSAEPKGRIGLWSKADSQVLFDDFKVEALDAAPSKPAVSHDVVHDP
jgi:hypothetical protein